jgi:hypothetical protein
VSFVLIIGLQYTWIRLSIFNEYSSLKLINFGILISLIVCKMIICSVAKVWY